MNKKKKKKAVAGFLVATLVTTIPWATGFAEGQKWTNVNAYEEQDGSKFNS
ncbi:hypothetical protein [Neobacillus vireti]